MSVTVGIMGVIVCLMAQSFFSGTEMAMVSANRARLQSKAESGHRGAHLALSLLEGQEARLLGTCLIGTNICLVTGTTLFRATMIQMGVANELIHTILFVPVALVLGEALPKIAYRHHADTLAPILSWAIDFFARVFAVGIWVVGLWADLLKTLARSEDTIRRQDIVQLLEDDGGQIDPRERQLIQRLLATAGTRVGGCMTPLIHVHAVPDTATVQEAVQMISRFGTSRLPVFQERIDNIIGRVDHRALLHAPTDDTLVSTIMAPALFVPESKRVDQLLREMRDAHDPMRIVVDEYGGTVGLVTHEDLLEEIVGKIEDERDRPGPGIQRINDREWKVPARVELEDLEEALEIELPACDYETIAGLVLAAMGRIPKTGESVHIGPIIVSIETATDRAIHLLRVRKL